MSTTQLNPASDAKRCSRCGTTKPHADFYRDRSKGDGLSSACRPCCAAKRDEWREKNPERYRQQYVAQNRRHYDQNREYYRERSWVASMQRFHGLETDDDTRLFAAVLRRDPCCYCGRLPGEGEHFGIDHIEPISGGGAHHWSNLTAACKECNSQKWTRTALQFLLWRASHATTAVDMAA